MPDPLSDGPMVAAALLYDPLCLPCVAIKTSIPPARIRRALQRVAKSLLVVETLGACAGCGRRKTVIRVGGTEG